MIKCLENKVFIASDMDGVLIDFCTPYLQKVWDTHPELRDIIKRKDLMNPQIWKNLDDYDINHWLEVDGNICPEITSGDFYGGLTPIKAMHDALKDKQLFIVSKSHPVSFESKGAWIKRWFPKANYHLVDCSPGSGEQKVSVFLDPNMVFQDDTPLSKFDVWLEDNTRELLGVRNVFGGDPDRYRIIDYGYNRGVAGVEDVPRIYL